MDEDLEKKRARERELKRLQRRSDIDDLLIYGSMGIVLLIAYLNMLSKG